MLVGRGRVGGGEGAVNIDPVLLSLIDAQKNVFNHHLAVSLYSNSSGCIFFSHFLFQLHDDVSPLIPIFTVTFQMHELKMNKFVLEEKQIFYWMSKKVMSQKVLRQMSLMKFKQSVFVLCFLSLRYIL